MWLKQHQRFKNLQEHSFKKIVTVIPVILPGGDKLSKVSDENLTAPKPKTTRKKQSNLSPPLTIKQSNGNTQDLTNRWKGCGVWVWVVFPPPAWHTNNQIRPAGISTQSLCQPKQVTSYCFRTALQNCSLPSTPPPPKAQPQRSTSWLKPTVWTCSKH